MSEEFDPLTNGQTDRPAVQQSDTSQEAASTQPMHATDSAPAEPVIFATQPTSPMPPAGQPSSPAADYTQSPAYRAASGAAASGSRSYAYTAPTQSTEPIAQPTQAAEQPAYRAAQPTQPVEQSARHAAQPMHSYDDSYANAGYASAATTAPVTPVRPAAPAPSAAAPSKKQMNSGVKTFLIAFGGAAAACVLAVVICFGTGLIGTHASSSSSSTTSSSTTLGSTTTQAVAVDADTTLAEAVADKCLPSVVCVYVYTAENTGYYGGSSTSSSLTESSLGSGVVLTEDGYIITNYHVIEGASALKVNIEGTEYDADIIGSDSSSDIAVIKARNASGLTPIEIGDSDSLNIGEWVMTIGSPFGLEQSVATGIVSATSRSQVYTDSSSSDYYSYIYGSSSSTYTFYVNMIQTDAAINPGNSGGALVDADGKLIGINTLITSYSGNYSGVGFAIPVNYAIKLAQQIINGEEITHAYMGISTVSVTQSIAQRYGLSTSEGAYVSAVTSGTGAESAGIKEGDIITKIGDTDVTSASEATLAVREHNPGDTVDVVINRSGETLTLKVTLGESTDTSTSSSSSSSNSGSGSSGSSIYDYLFGNGSGSGSGSGTYGYGYGSGSGSGM